MGYWEQIGEENRRYKEEWDRLPPWRRTLRRAGFAGLLIFLAILPLRGVLFAAFAG